MYMPEVRQHWCSPLLHSLGFPVVVDKSMSEPQRMSEAFRNTYIGISSCNNCEHCIWAVNAAQQLFSSNGLIRTLLKEQIKVGHATHICPTYLNDFMLSFTILTVLKVKIFTCKKITDPT